MSILIERPAETEEDEGITIARGIINGIILSSLGWGVIVCGVTLAVFYTAN